MTRERGSRHRAGTDCDVCVSHLSFRFSSALELFEAVHNTPFTQVLFQTSNAQTGCVEFRESKFKREGSYLEQSWRHTGGVHTVCMRGGDLIYRHLLFKKLGFLEFNCGLFFSQVLFQTSNAPT